MCHAVPCPIQALHQETNEATVNLAGVTRRVRLDMLAEPPKVGDYVLVHVGYALTPIDPFEAEATLRLMAEAVAVSTASSPRLPDPTLFPT